MKKTQTEKAAALPEFPEIFFLWIMMALWHIAQAAPLGAEAKETGKPPSSAKADGADIDGFRSARFGMAEKDVYRAIYKDFRVTKKNVTRHVHPVEKTVSLEIPVNNLLPDSGPSRVFYILGFRTGRLIQVNVLWGRPAGGGADPQKTVNVANQLRDYFSRQPFPKQTRVLNRPVSDRLIVVFRGQDLKGRMVLLLLTNPPKQDAKTAPLSLKLSYIQKPGKPDVFEIPKGQF